MTETKAYHETEYEYHRQCAEDDRRRLEELDEQGQWEKPPPPREWVEWDGGEIPF